MTSEQLTILCDGLKENGYRLTAARRAILSALVATKGHISADELGYIVKEKDKKVGRMTVYRTLDLLSELGLIRPIYQGTGAAHYILLVEGYHHHLICSACSKVIEFDQCVIDDIERLISKNFGFSTQSHLLEIYGRCQDCHGD